MKDIDCLFIFEGIKCHLEQKLYFIKSIIKFFYFYCGNYYLSLNAIYNSVLYSIEFILIG